MASPCWARAPKAAAAHDRLVSAERQAGIVDVGDSRGRRSAAMLIGGIGAGYGGGSDIEVDLRVDDHPDPVAELGRLLDIHALLFGKPSETWPLDGEVAQRLRRALNRLGYDDPDLEQALERAAGIENLEERLVPDAIDPVVLQYLESLGDA